jgi:hypothetical protein
MIVLKMSDTSRKFLKKNCPELLKENNLRSFLLKLDDFIITEGLDENDNMTAFGHEAQAVYDEIYMCNE